MNGLGTGTLRPCHNRAWFTIIASLLIVYSLSLTIKLVKGGYILDYMGEIVKKSELRSFSNPSPRPLKGEPFP